MFSLRRFSILIIVITLLLAGAFVAYAFHSWNGYHWARTANPFTVKLGDNVSSIWDARLGGASSDWSQSNVLDTAIVPGQSKENCRPTKGRVEVCNKTYGNNGWLGMATIWISGSHITQGTVKVNDTYFNTSFYNTTAWRNLVMCQEVGHTLGLDHQDENFYNPPLGTCMDYTIDPTPNQHPNAHDYEELGIIYGHLDSFTTLLGKVANSRVKVDKADNKADDIDTSNPAELGKEIRKDRNGKGSLFERDLGKGEKVFTFVIWADLK